MKTRRIILLLTGLLFICLVGTVSASENKDTTDVIDSISAIDDSRTAIEIVTEGNKDLKNLQEDPTNVTRLQEAVEKPFDIMFGGDIHDAKGVERAVYGWIILEFLGAFIALLAPIILPLLRG